MADDEDSSYSIVEYMNGHSGYRCGYCKSEDTNFSHGMWAHKMSVQNYQDLIDRGWRRSGKYCYKPTMNKTCCPHYTIKCDAFNFKLSKSQKKVLKRMHAYLSYGTKKNIADSEGNHSPEVYETDQFQPRHHVERDLSEVKVSVTNLKEQQKGTVRPEFQALSKKFRPENSKSEQESTSHENVSCTASANSGGKKVKPGLGPDPSKPPCKKAKLIRKERHATKVAFLSNEHHVNSDPAKGGSTNQPKSLEDFLNAPLPDSPAHRLEVRMVTALRYDGDYNATLEESHSVYKKYQMTIHKEPESKCTKSKYERFLCNSSLQLRLVPVSSLEPKFTRTFKSSYGVFRNYQMAIHHDPPNECEESSFKNFLVDGPLTPWKPTSGPPQGYGPFHQQYWLDGQLIAVGVIDILPYCASSVYLYYNPEFSFLSLGTYSSLREIALTRELNRSAPNLKWYYMGFYIHSCPKMRYKGNYSPSFLLCPETYSWVPIGKCIPKLNVSKYSRLNDKSLKEAKLDVNKVLCLHNGCPYLFGVLKRMLRRRSDEEEVREYMTLAGAKAAYSMLLYRH